MYLTVLTNKLILVGLDELNVLVKTSFRLIHNGTHGVTYLTTLFYCLTFLVFHRRDCQMFVKAHASSYLGNRTAVCHPTTAAFRQPKLYKPRLCPRAPQSIPRRQSAIGAKLTEKNIK